MIKEKKINDITLIYDTVKNKNIEEIENTIKLNPTLLNSYQGKNLSLVHIDKENTIFIEDFDVFFQEQIKSLLNNKYFMSVVKKGEVLFKLYIALINKEESLLTNDSVFTYIATRYYMENKDWNTFFQFLKTHDNKLELENWLKDKSRFSTYNHYLKIITNSLNQQDFIFFDNFEEIFSKVLIDLAKINNKEDLPLKKKDEAEKIFLDFLNRIGAPQSWCDLYIQLKENHGMTKDSDKVSCCYLDMQDNQVKINVNSDGFIDGFITLVHEFSHYVSMSYKYTLGKEDCLKGIAEFPAIFFEKLAAKYLIEIGYPKSIVESIASFRNQNNFLIVMPFYNIFVDIQKYNNGEVITLENKVEEQKRRLNIETSIEEKLTNYTTDNQEIVKLIEYLQNKKFNYEEIVKKNIDEDVKLLYQKGNTIIEIYQYLIGNHIADILLEQDLEIILPKMFNITTHLEYFTLSQVLKYLGIENIWKATQNGEVKKRKRS